MGGEVLIDLGAVAENFTRLSALARSPVGAVVKADAYGLGAPSVSRALEDAGCRHFFVADLAEALALKSHLGAASRLYVLHGLWPGTEALAAEADVIPVLNSLGQVQAWRDAARMRGVRLAAALQADTGMSRLGLAEDESAWIAATPEVFEDLDVRLLMTHLACAEVVQAPQNDAQIARFRRLATVLPAAGRSVANSAAILTEFAPGEGLARSGLALYGVSPGPQTDLRAAVAIRARVIQARTIGAGVGVGYGLSYVADETRRIATISIGYADGWPRALSDRGAVYVGDLRLPVIGRVSMDSCVVDASQVAPGALKAGDWVELVGPHQTLEQVAAAAGTIAYEILVNLGQRLARRYTSPPAALSQDV